MYYNECPFCGANLDPGEICDCREEDEHGNHLQGDRTGGRDHSGRSGGFQLCTGKMPSRNLAGTAGVQRTVGGMVLFRQLGEKQ